MTTLNTTSHAHSAVATNFVTRHPLLSFFTLAIVVTWLASLPSLLLGLPFKPFQTAGAYGPLRAAVITSAALGRDELKSLFTRMTHFHFGFRWYMIFTLYLPALFTSYLVYPIGEEIGWTGFALPYLQKRSVVDSESAAHAHT